MALRLGRSDITADESHLRIHADTRVIGHCTGTFENKAVFLIQDGDLTVKQLGAADYIKAEPHQVAEVLAALNATFGEALKAPRAIINDAGKFVLLDTAPPTAFETSARTHAKAVADVLSGVLKATAEATEAGKEWVGITGAVVRKNGMVSMARRMIEDGVADPTEDDVLDIAAALKAAFDGLPDLNRLVEVAIREARDDTKNNTEDFGTVSQFNVDRDIVVRLEAGDHPDLIRDALRPTLVRVPGRRIERSPGEVESILDIAFDRAEALRKVRANKASRRKAVVDTADKVVNYANRLVGNPQRTVRDNGMVTHARRLLETQTPTEVAEAFETHPRFGRLANLPELTRVALDEAVNKKANRAAAEAILVRDNLANIIANRLNGGESADDIRTSLLPNYQEFTPATGAPIQRGAREVDEIVNLAMTRGRAVYEGRQLESAGSLRVAVRNNGMVSEVRYRIQEGESEDDIRRNLARDFTGPRNLSDLISTALAEYREGARNLNWAQVVENRLGLGQTIVSRLNRGEGRGMIEADLRADLRRSFVIRGINIHRSDEEIGEIVSAALAEADKILEKKENVPDAELVRRANELGMVVEAALRITQGGQTPAQAEASLIGMFYVDGVRELAAVAVREAQDTQKVYWTLYRLLERNGEAARILTERAAAVSPAVAQANIRSRLVTTYAEYEAPDGRRYPRCDRDLAALVRAANEQADALERNRAAEVLKARNAANTKNIVKAWVPGTEQAGWDKRLVDSGTIRYIRQEREVPSCDEDTLRSQVITRLAGESDPEGMADYALGRATDTNFNRKEAERVAFMDSFDRMARVELGRTGATVGSAEAVLTAEILAVHSHMHFEEAREIAQAAIRRAQNLQNWEDRGARAEAWARGPGWEGLKTAGKVGAAATGLLGLGTAAVATVGTILGLGLAWKGLKFAGRTVKGSMPYVLPLGAAAVKTTLDATVGVAKFARNTALYAPATWIGNTFTRAYQGARAGWNFPTPARKEKPLIKEKKGWSYPFTAMGNLFRRTTTGTGNLLRGLWHRGKQSVLVPAALAAGLTVGFGEGLGKAGHHILGYEWNGSEAVDHLAEETSHAPAAPAPHGNAAASPKKAAASAPAAAKHH